MNFLTKTLSNIFGGSKHEKDIKTIQPLVDKTNIEFAKLASLSHDALRNKTGEFKERIKKHLSAIDSEMEQLKLKSEALSNDDIASKDEIYRNIDELKKERDKEIEKILLELLPEAFAVMKETARRFTENNELIVQATQLDKDLSVSKDFVTIKMDNAIYKNEWIAAGGQIKWNMIHYDVQLIGGIVLHQGKIAEMATGEGKHL